MNAPHNPEHAPLAPSAADRWVQCPGSVSMAAAYPEEDTPDSLAGTAAHWACAELLRGQQIDIGVIAPNGTILDEEMCEAADIYADAVLPYVTSTAALSIETRVFCPHIHADNWGTPDAWVMNRPRKHLLVADFKFGHRLVDPFENWQLINYTAGILEAHEINGVEDQELTVTMRIVQPRGYHRDGPVRDWTIRASDLRPYFNQLTIAAAQAAAPNAPLQTGEACRDCPARHACPALQAAALIACDVAGESLPLELTPDALGRELGMLRAAIERLEARETGLTAAALGIARAGQRVPGFAVQQGLGRERWARPLSEIFALGRLLGIDLCKPAAITPKQAIKAGITANVVQMYSETPLGEVKLVPDGARLAAVFNRNTTGDTNHG